MRDGLDGVVPESSCECGLHEARTEIARLEEERERARYREHILESASYDIRLRLDREYQRSQSRVQSLTADVAQLRADLKRSQRAAQEIASAKDSLQTRVDELAAEAKRLSAQLQKSAADRRRLKKRCAELREANTTQRAEIDSLLASRSWRMTAPIRAIGGGLRSLANAVRSPR
ncbi:MAG: hypothetical protein ACXIUP_07620 [Microcella sp.]